MKKSVMLIIAVMVLVFAQSVMAEPLTKAEAPVLVPGESWAWVDEWGEDRKETYSGKKDGVLVFERSRGRKRIRTEELNLMYDVSAEGEIGKVCNPHMGYLSFPLFVGKEWKHSYTYDKRKFREVTFEVVGVETITTKGGTFECFVISGVDYNTNAEVIAGIRIKIWYSPAVKNIVKMTGEEAVGRQVGKKVEGSNYELVRYKQPQPLAATVK